MTGRKAARGVAMAIVALLLIGGAGYVAWQRGWIGPEDEVPVEVSPEAAAIAEQKLVRLRDDGRTARLSGVELSSLLRYRSPRWVTNMVAVPSIVLSADTLRLFGTVSTDQLPSHPELDAARAFLPDNSRIEVAGQVRSLPSGRIALHLLEVEVAGLPVPRRYFPLILEKVGRPDEPELPENAVALQLPAGVGSARIEHGILILTP